MCNENFFDGKFENYNEIDGNAWRFNWRASQLHRMSKAAECINKIISCSDHLINICEIGCASADFTNMYYKENIMNVLGIDLSNKAIQICREKYRDKVNIRFSQGNILDFKLSQKFDLVICMDVLHYFNEEEQRQALRNLKDLLVNDGKCVLMIPISDRGSEEKFVNNVQEQFSKVSYKHVYTEFYQKKFESKCLWLYDVMTVNNQFKCIGRFFAKIIKKMVKSLWLFDIVSRFDKNHVPSHIIVLAEN